MGWYGTALSLERQLSLEELVHIIGIFVEIAGL